MGYILENQAESNIVKYYIRYNIVKSTYISFWYMYRQAHLHTHKHTDIFSTHSHIEQIKSIEDVTSIKIKNLIFALKL